jgi:hypothetical protein
MFGNKKAQSAMEYLMTYGWAILIIAIVLAALFSLGVFSSSSFTGTVCVASSGFLCSNPILHNGNFVATIGQATGTSWSSAALCFVTSGTTMGTANTVSCPSGISGSPTGALASGQSESFTFSIPSASTVGSTISGSIWAVYDTSSSGPVYETQIATVTAKAV